MIEKLKALVQKWAGLEKLPENVVKTVEEMPEEIAKSHVERLEVLEPYYNDMPEDFKTSITTFIKAALLPSEEISGDLTPEIIIEKAGSVFSKATRAQLEKIAEIVNSLLNKAGEKTKATDSDKDLSDEVKAKLRKLADLEELEEKRKAAEIEAKEKTRDEKLKKLEDEISNLKKEKGTSHQKAIDKKDDDDKDKDKDKKDKSDVDLFPSIRIF